MRRTGREQGESEEDWEGESEEDWEGESKGRVRRTGRERARGECGGLGGRKGRVRNWFRNGPSLHLSGPPKGG